MCGGMVSLEHEFVRQLRDLTSELGMLLIFDEIITLRAAFGACKAITTSTPT